MKNKKYIICKSPNISHTPYAGPTCLLVGVELGKCYTSKKEAWKDANKLNAENPVGFAVVEKKDPKPPSAKIAARRLFKAAVSTVYVVYEVERIYEQGFRIDCFNASKQESLLKSILGIFMNRGLAEYHQKREEAYGKSVEISEIDTDILKWVIGKTEDPPLTGE